MIKQDRMALGLLITHKRAEIKQLREGLSVALLCNDDKLGLLMIENIGARRIQVKRLEKMLDRSRS